MRKKLLNILKNLIIIITLVLILSSIPTSVFAVDSNLATVMKQKISSWYMIIRAVSLAVMLILLIVLGIRLGVMTVSAYDKALLKRLLVDWIIGLALVLFIHYIMFYTIKINEGIVFKTQNWGMKLSGIDPNSKSDEYDEVTLYESAISKAYELRFTSGTIGMIMYMMLVFYTYKFLFVYIKRYINIIVMILIAPIICVIYSFKKVISGGKSKLLGTWFKEFFYNVFIQSIHAAFYASLIGMTIRLSDSTETYIGAILTLIIFGFIFKLDGIIRKLLNFVGGSSSVKSVDIVGTFKNAKNMATDFQNGEGAIHDKMNSVQNYFSENSKGQIAADVGNKILKMKDSAVAETKNTLLALDGKKIKITKEELDKEIEKSKNPTLGRKVLNGVQTATYAVTGAGFVLAENIGKITKEKITNIIEQNKKDIDTLQQNVEMIKRLPKVIKAHDNEELPDLDFIYRNERQYQTAMNLSRSAQEVIEEMKRLVEEDVDDIVASVYSVEGPQALIYAETGSPYMGMSVIAAENYSERYQYVYMQDESKRTLSAPSIVSQNAPQASQRSKKYKFNRFSSKSVRTIVHAMNRRVVLNSAYLRRLNKVSGTINLGNMQVTGRAPGARRTKISYTAKIKSLSSISQSTYLELETYRERVQDGNWAKITSIASDIKMTTKNRIDAALNKISQVPAVNLAINKLVDMGQATKLNEKFTLIHDKVNSVVSTIMPIAMNKVQVVQNAIGQIANAPIVQSILEVTGEKSLVNLIPNSVIEEHPAVTILQKLGVVKQDKVVQYVLADNGSVVEQVLDADGNILKPAEDENGSLIKSAVNQVGQYIQHVVTMDGNVIEQILNIEGTEAKSVVIPEINENGELTNSISERISEASYDVQDVLEDIRNRAFFEVSDNLEQVQQEQVIENKFIEMVQVINTITTVEATDQQEQEKRSGLDQLISQITPPATYEETQAQIADSVIIDTAINFGVSDLHNLDIEDNPDAKKQVLDSLIERGVVSTRVREDENATSDILASMQLRKNTIATEQPDLLANTIIQREVANIVQVEVTSNGVNPNAIQDINMNEHLGTLSQLVESIAVETVKAQAKQVQEEIAKEVKMATDFAKDEIKKGEELYSLEGTGEQAKTKVKVTAKKVANKLNTILGGKKSGDEKEKYDKDDEFTVRIYGAVIVEGQYSLKIGSRLRDLIVKAGGLTDYADLTKINVDEFLRDGGDYRIPSRVNDKDTDKMLARCLKVAKEEIEKYLKENNIPQVATLRKLVHRNMILSILRREFKNENITREQIEQLIEEGIKEVEEKRRKAEKALKGMSIIENKDIKPSKESTDDEIKREKAVIKNSEEDHLDDLISNISSDKPEETEDSVLDGLLKNLESEREKVLVGKTSSDEKKEEPRRMYVGDNASEMARKLILSGM